MAAKFLPLMRTTPTPALPGAVAIAMMGNCLVIIAMRFSWDVYAISQLLGAFFSKHLIDLPLLSNR